jgi:phenylacetate-CoA ligase
MDFKEAFSLRKIIVTAEPLPPSLRQAFTDEYALSVVNAYGTAEFGLLGINAGQGMAMQLLPEPVVEVVDPETGKRVGAGETGEVVATNFSRAYPLIRIGTGDMAMNIDPNPGHSSQEERAIMLVGRSGDAAKVRGLFVHPNQLRFTAGQIPGVSAIQGVVSRPDLKDHFVLRVEIDEGADETSISEQLSESVRNLCRVRVDRVQIVAKGTIGQGDPGMVDQRSWE